MLTKRSRRAQSAIGRYGYFYHILLDSPSSSTTTTNVIKTTTQETIIPIASLFSSMDIVHRPSTEMKKASPLLRRSKTSIGQHEQDTNDRRLTSENLSRLSTCFHSETKHDLCHQCHQRNKRNIPVYVHDEKRQRELDETKILEQYQHDKDLEEQKKREVDSLRIVAFALCSFFLFLVLVGDENSTRRTSTNCCCMQLFHFLFL